MIRLLNEYPSAAMLALLGLGSLIAYVAARGRRLGAGDLLAFAIVAAIFDLLAVLVYGMWEHGSAFNLIVMGGLLFIVPIAALSTLGAGVIAVRMLHIALTGGRAPPPSDTATQRRRKLSGMATLFTWMIAPVQWRGVCVAFAAFTLFVMLNEIHCECGPVGAAALMALAMLACAAGTLGVIGYVRWYSTRKRETRGK